MKPRPAPSKADRNTTFAETVQRNFNRNKEDTNMTTTETKSNARIQNWQQDTDKTVRGLTSYDDANDTRNHLLAKLKNVRGPKPEWQVKVRKRPSGTFDVLVSKRLKSEESKS